MELTTSKPIFGLASDLHMDFEAMNPEFFDWRGDVLLLAGDLAEEDRLRKMKSFWDGVVQMAPEVYMVCGNHEHYGSEIDSTHRHLREFLAEKYPSVKLLENDTVVTRGVAIFGATMWADFQNRDPMVMWDAQSMMNDYRQIRVKSAGYRPLRPVETLGLHVQSLRALEKSLEEHSELPFVVMTHHAPTFQNINPAYTNSKMNGAYATDLEEFIIGHRQIQAWVHGHIHYRNMTDIEGCQVMVNTRGYPGERPAHLPPYQPLSFKLEI